MMRSPDMDLTDGNSVPLDELTKLILVQDLCRAARREVDDHYTHRLRTLLDMALLEIECVRERLDREPVVMI